MSDKDTIAVNLTYKELRAILALTVYDESVYIVQDEVMCTNEQADTLCTSLYNKVDAAATKMEG